jgi:hypothetical protein
MKQKEVSLAVAVALAVVALVAVVGIGLYLVNRHPPLRRDIMARQAGGKVQAGGRTAAPQTGMVGNVSE